MNYEQLPKELPLIPLKGSVIFPGSTNSIRLSTPDGTPLLEELEKKDYYTIGLAIRQNIDESSVQESDLYIIGTLLKVDYTDSLSNGYELKVRSLERVEVHNISKETGLLKAGFTLIPDVIDMDEDSLASLRDYLKQLSKDIAANFNGAEGILKKIEQYTDTSDLMNYIAQHLNISRTEKQALLEIQSIRERGLKILDYLIHQKESLKLQVEMAQKFSEKASKAYRENILREQMKAIQEELGQKDKKTKNSLREQIDASDMPDDVREIALDELEKLETQGPNNPDSHIIRNYLDLLVALPWQSKEDREINLETAREILESRHYGLEKVKDRIIQHLAVMKLKTEKKGSILLLVGPPGTGKTSLGKSIAEALGREFIRISLGGIRDEAEIRGHRRTYIGALPGRIIQGMKKAGTKNPVFVLDEIDKLMRGFGGDPSSALLEVLDPEQNNTFSDHYLEIPYDLSDVFFIATANTLESIPGPLVDRLEMITLSGYTNHEKFFIGKQHLIPKVLKEHGISSGQLVIEDGALSEIIENYTREAGVRELQRKIADIARITSEHIVSGNEKLPYTVMKEMVEELLGRERVRHEIAEADNPPGVATGLAWTPVGGEILFIESTHMPGTGQLTMTGQLGDVMKESAQISLSLIRSRLALFSTSFNIKEKDIHIHIPSGAVPKDGPSAGTALFTSLASLVIGKKVDPKLALTGEITLRGSILPVGGIKEKVIAAHRAGIKRVIMPKENEKDLKDVPEEVIKGLEFIPVERIEEVLNLTMDIQVPDPEDAVMIEYTSKNGPIGGEI